MCSFPFAELEKFHKAHGKEGTIMVWILCGLTFWSRRALNHFPGFAKEHHWELHIKLSRAKACRNNHLGVHRNQYFKFRPEPDLTGTRKKFRPELLTGTFLLSHILLCPLPDKQPLQVIKERARKCWNKKIEKR
jgi:hypothetical protein